MFATVTHKDCGKTFTQDRNGRAVCACGARLPMAAALRAGLSPMYQRGTLVTHARRGVETVEVAA